MWCCGKVDVIEPVRTDTLKVDVAIASKPIVLVSRADLENQIIVVKKDVEVADIAEAAESAESAEAADAETELTRQTITALLGIALIFGATYLAFAKPDETFYIDAPHDL